MPPAETVAARGGVTFQVPSGRRDLLGVERVLQVSEHLERARRYHEVIHRVLLNEWDPIGVRDIPTAKDEYDSYISEVYGLLIRREPRHKLVDFLWWVETQHMGLRGNRPQTELVADRLLRIPDEVG
ncbi:MAG TPA: hypothetical protein VKD71_11130 [Gemmataceae bacterium]|nr:hypothetical protein [Gemmataceae bacterium]